MGVFSAPAKLAAVSLSVASFGSGSWFKLLLIHLIMGLTVSEKLSAVPILPRAVPDYATAEAGNPFVEGLYADPDTETYDGLYWVFPTSSYAYEQQTYLDAFSSSDLINWTKYPNILTTANVTWATKAVWAPAPISRNGKYYLYFGANDIQEGEPENGVIGGIGVAVADRPEGPYVDAIGKPLIGEYHNGAQPIDQDVFIDDDGQAYIYYGGHSYANVAKLNEDMISIGTLDDGTQFKEITPENYVEGSQMIKRNGVYYFMWSEGGWTGPDYSVSYAMADSPLGPFPRKAKILQQDSAVAKGSGHNGVIHVPDTDIWYIVYHRRPLSESDGNHRVLAYDRMYFNDDGTIQPVKMLVQDNFADGTMIAWKMHGGEWSVVDQRLTVSNSGTAQAMLDTNFTDLIFDATVTITEGGGDAGLVFRATTLETGDIEGYYAGISPVGIVTLWSLGSVNEGKGSLLLEVALQISLVTEHHLRVSAVGNEIRVFVDDLEEPKIVVTDDEYPNGADGVGVRNAAAKFGDISVAKPS
ncbi:carbohydrate-binding module family 66 protein [Xylariaceae sp. FL0662B]|nr:carbohydrate-binding module family 66 protein [Xylariaceae sp. FL0662B]